jgi:hypothetical protein
LWSVEAETITGGSGTSSGVGSGVLLIALFLLNLASAALPAALFGSSDNRTSKSPPKTFVHWMVGCASTFCNSDSAVDNLVFVFVFVLVLVLDIVKDIVKVFYYFRFILGSGELGRNDASHFFDERSPSPSVFHKNVSVRPFSPFIW